MRKWVVGFLACGLVLFGALFALVRPWPCQVNRAAFEQIKEGMTQVEVYAILGGPPGDYRTRPPAQDRFFSRFGSGPYHLTEVWEGDDGEVLVHYQPGPAGDDTVWYVTFDEGVPIEPGLLELVRGQLARLKERLLP